MKILNNRILVRVNFAQKDFSGGLLRAKLYNLNHRDKQPVMCECLQTNGGLMRGDYLLVHHNFFHEGSPYQVEDDVFSVILNHNIFARLDKDGKPHSVFGNIMAERIPVPTLLEMPPESKPLYKDRVRVISSGEGFTKGAEILILQYADYEIIYNWKGDERRVIKVAKEEIIGKILKNG